MDLTIGAMGAQGDGIAPGPTYVLLSLPGERITAKVSGQWGEIVSIETPSPQRVEPPCPHFGACGGCALQHWDHAAYLAWKVEQVRNLLAHERIETDFAPAFAAQPGTRRRVALHARTGKGGAQVGYKGRRSWALTPIDQCVIADPRITRVLPTLRRVAAHLFQHPKSAPTLHLTLTETGFDLDITGVEKKSGGLSADAGVRIAAIAAEADFARVTLDGDAVFMQRQPMVRFGRASVALPAGGFLQAVAAAETAMADFAIQAISGARKTADLFCGSGAFTFRLAEVSSVIAADSGEGAIKNLRAGIGTAAGLKAITAEARDLFRRPLLAAQELKTVDAVLFDPPRAGAEVQAREIARSKAEVVVGVSCNPATFARDASILIAGGYRLERILPVDQFLWSPHIEVVGVFRR